LLDKSCLARLLNDNLVPPQALATVQRYLTLGYYYFPEDAPLLEYSYVDIKLPTLVNPVRR
jgi:hypothetical protein